MDRKPGTMSDTPKFTVIDRRKFKAEEEQESQKAAAPELAGAPGSQPAQAPPVASASTDAGPRLVVNENKQEPGPAEAQKAASGEEALPELPPAPTDKESHEQK